LSHSAALQVGSFAFCWGRGPAFDGKSMLPASLVL
jgi:hypothetical protein